jgi:hypothetical protein
MIALLAATALVARLGATTAEPYDFYKSGRPRRVVAYFQDASDVRLLRLPDRDRGKARVLDHEVCDAGQCALEWAHLIDPYDLVISMDIGRGYAVADRIRGDRFVRIWEGEVSFTPDLDGDGVDASKHYVVHVYRGGHALLDDEPLTPGEVFTTEDSCHIFAVKGTKSAWAFLEERP